MAATAKLRTAPEAPADERRQSVVERLERRSRRTDVVDLRGMQLSGVDLAGLDLSSCDLSGADLSAADLTGAHFRKSDLTGAQLTSARIEGADFLGAKLVEADMRGALARRASFGRSDLTHANLLAADLTETTFTGTCLRNADLRTAKLDGARFRDADLAEADLTRGSLTRTDFESCTVGRARFDAADMRGAQVRAIFAYETASWIDTDIADVDFHGAYMLRRFVMDQNYLHEFRNRNRSSAALYWVWWVTSDCGRSFTRWALWSFLLVALFAELYCFVELDLGAHPTVLSQLYFSVVTFTTLGYGDVVPATLAGQILTMIQVLLGYVMLGGLLGIFANKMARRAE